MKQRISPTPKEVSVMRRKIWLLALVGAVLLGVSPALADGDFYVVVVPGGVGTKITSLPYTITAPGFYYLTGNLTCPSGVGITINSDDVTIDLMGFRLSSSTVLSGTGISMNGKKTWRSATAPSTIGITASMN
jgi:hypothetical protein